MTSPKPSLEWVLTEHCNYNCPYCCFEGKNGHCSDEIIEACFTVFSQLEGSWLIKLVGGEPMIHPRFLEVCEKIVKYGHKLCLTTNFSLPLTTFQKLVDICGDKLDYITASMHMDQIDSMDDFIEKAVAFISIKDPKTKFIVTSVVRENDFERLKIIEERLTTSDVTFKFQVMKIRGNYVRYTEDIEHYISGKLIDHTEQLRGRNLFGTLCHAGELFFKINVNGEAVRCYSQQPHFYLGNVKGAFARHNQAKPCLARKCTCTVPANRHMIRFGEKTAAFITLKAYATGLLKNLPSMVRNRLSRYR